MVRLSSLHIENFRGFQHYDVELEEQTVVVGANNSGKTSVLWAIILFLRAFNTQMFITTEELKEILNWENAKALALVFNPTTNTKFSLVGTFEGGARAQFEFEAIGYLKILLVDSDALPKARFAFVGCGEPYFCAGAKEPRDISRLSSFMGISRSLFDALSDEFKGAIKSFMGDVFGIWEINKSKYDLFVKETHGIEIEIMFAGSATRKVFATLVLLYTLAQADPHCMRVLAVEEPEALLCPSIAFAFISRLSLECQKYKIQLVLSSTAYSFVPDTMLKQIDLSVG
jgi:AAA15 family ATPase/GTPase